MNNRNSRILKWAMLLLVPIVVFAVMLPIARERRKVALTQQLIEEAHTKSRLGIMKKLVAQGANVNGQLPDWNVAMKGSSALHFLVLKYKTDQRPQMSFLLSHGADIDIRNEYGLSPLILSASVGAVPSVKFMIENGANVNARANSRQKVGSGLTALGIARANLKAEKAKGGEIVPQLEETIRILEAAGAKE